MKRMNQHTRKKVYFIKEILEPRAESGILFLLLLDLRASEQNKKNFFFLELHRELFSIVKCYSWKYL